MTNFIRKDIKRWTTTIAEVSQTQAAKSGQVPKVVGYWMGGIAVACFGAVSLGGVTRLTESGLSMVDWKLFGRPPPKNAEEWDIEFEKYKESPEYKWKNSDISMEDFKFIWAMEYGHRMWGRCIGKKMFKNSVNYEYFILSDYFSGAFYYIPAAVMWARGYFTPALKKRVAFGGVLLACQGLMGWYMVKSGLDHDNFLGPNDVPRVSQYRLASHLSLAMVLYSFMLWNSLSILKPTAKTIQESIAKLPKDKIQALLSVRKLAMGTKGLVFFTAVSGAFVAGLDAGLTYNSFPLMAGKVIPDDLFAYAPWLSNFTENPTTVQFDHRYLYLFIFIKIDLSIWILKIVMMPVTQKSGFRVSEIIPRNGLKANCTRIFNLHVFPNFCHI